MDILYTDDNETLYKIGEKSTFLSRYPMIFSLEEEFDETSDFFRIMGTSPGVKKNPYLKMRESLGLTNRELLYVMTSDARSDIMKETVDLIKEILSDEQNESYVDYYLQQRKFLDKLVKPTLSNSFLLSLANKTEHENTSKKIKEYVTDNEKTSYKMSGTATGRLVVKSGPNILTLPSDVRKGLKTRYKSGKILQMDLISAEPYMALLYMNQDLPDDIYQHISEVILENKVSRNHAKIITLSALYGQSAKNLSKSLPPDINAKDVIESTKRYFRVNELKRILEESLKNRNFRNALGRPIKIEENRRDLLVSYFLQSSVAECSIVSFDNFIEGTSLKLTPYYVIHDALIFDADQESADYLLNLKKVPVKAGNWLFQAKVTLISDI